MVEIRDDDNYEVADMAVKKAKSNKAAFLVGALLLTLAITGGLFAYTQTTSSAQITVTSGGGNFATVDNASLDTISFTVFGRAKGSIDAGTLFTITTPDEAGPDIEVNVYLSNADELSKVYGNFLLRLKLVDGLGAYADIDGADKPLTLNNGVVSFILQDYTVSTSYYVECAGGTFRAFDWDYVSGNVTDAEIFCEAIQVGLG